MPADYLHTHRQFADLIRIVAEARGIDPALVEKDYWIMHCLYGLQRLGLTFQLKGGTSFSKGHQAIERFSEDIDILIEPPPGRDVKTGRNQDKPAHIESRRSFYDWPATRPQTISGSRNAETFCRGRNRRGCRLWRRRAARRASAPRERRRRSPAGTASTSGKRSRRSSA